MSAADYMRACDVVETALKSADTWPAPMPTWLAKPLATSVVAALIAAGWTLTPPSGT